MAPILGIYASSNYQRIAPDTGAMFPIAMAVGTGSSGTITFSNIPQTYKHLQIRVIGLYSSSAAEVYMSLNADENNSNYTRHYIYGDGSSAVASSDVNVGQTRSIAYSATSSTTTPTPFIVDILDYTSTSKKKVSRILVGREFNGSGVIGLTSQLWNATPAAITSIKLATSAGNFNQYSQFALYGIKG
jgi:hypothetical protein